MVKVHGQEISELPRDLYIPPDAMLVILEMFEGPLDLLLYLIKKNNIDIVDIPVASITKQYIDYVEYMQCANLELAADYLEMAAILIEIKSRMLLPVVPSEDPEEDPRATLVKRLQEYEQIKQAAANLDELPRQNRDFFNVKFDFSGESCQLLPEVQFKELLQAFQQVVIRQDLQSSHTIVTENLSIRDKMTLILSRLNSLQFSADNEENSENKFFQFADFFNFKEGKLGVVVTFLAMLELVKDNLLEIMQSDQFAPIYVRLVS